MNPKTHINCKNTNCNKLFKRYRTTQKYCSMDCQIKFEGRKEQKKRASIKPISDKRKVEKAIYDLERILFLKENKSCEIKGPTCTKIATTIEHTRGRKGFADNEKRDLGISLYLDKEFWKPACNNCNLELENNPELSRQHQLSKIHGGKKER